LLAVAMLRLMQEINKCCSSATAPSNAAADNIARRLRDHIRVRRYDQQVSGDLVDMSTMAMAEKAQGSGANRKAIKRWKEEERSILEVVDVPVALS